MYCGVFKPTARVRARTRALGHTLGTTQPPRVPVGWPSIASASKEGINLTANMPEVTMQMVLPPACRLLVLGAPELTPLPGPLPPRQQHHLAATRSPSPGFRAPPCSTTRPRTTHPRTARPRAALASTSSRTSCAQACPLSACCASTPPSPPYHHFKLRRAPAPRTPAASRTPRVFPARLQPPRNASPARAPGRGAHAGPAVRRTGPARLGPVVRLLVLFMGPLPSFVHVGSTPAATAA